MSNANTDAKARNVVVCCDGTWNHRKQAKNSVPSATNVVRLHAAVDTAAASDGPDQVKFYREGVGTSGNLWNKLKGGAFGFGIEADIESAYKWLAETRRDGDRIFLFGFSRGAYAARSLAGMIGKVGLLDLTDGSLEDAVKWDLTRRAMAEYRDWKDAPEKYRARAQLRGFPVKTPRIHFLGVWDTVGALGIPDDWAWISHIWPDPYGHKFHDTKLGSSVDCARHAVGADEMRVDFVPTLWNNIEGDPYCTVKPEEYHPGDAKQVWFPGVHSDLGGGYANRDLGDITLKWMMEEAADKGLGFRAGAIAGLKGDARGVLHDSLAGFWRNRQTRPRPLPSLDGPAPPPPHVSDALHMRFTNPGPAQSHYHRTVRLAPQQVEHVTVSSKPHWVETGLYLEAGRSYDFSARGQWLDSNAEAGPGGLDRTGLSHLLAAGAEAIRRFYRSRTGNPFAEPLFLRVCRRHESAPWFSLVGVIANGHGANNDTKRREEHEVFDIGASLSGFEPVNSGYLYCYANDAWWFYHNNRGSVTLRVEGGP